jgi:microcystin-dependent protein
MSNPYIGEIRLMGFNFNPEYWALCNGQLLLINENPVLYTLLGTQYGGDDRQNFALPDLRGRVPAHQGNGVLQGYALGSETATITEASMPNHTHALSASSQTADQKLPALNLLGKYDVDPNVNTSFAAAKQLVSMHAGSVSNNGGSQEHTNMQPFQVVSFCIALQGLFPSRD